MKSIIRYVFLLAVFSCLNQASAQTDEELLGIQIRGKVLSDSKEKPAIILNPLENTASVSVQLTDQTGKIIKLSAKNVRKNSRKEIPITCPKGRTDFKAEFTVTYANKKQSDFTIEFPVIVADPIKISVSKETVDLDNGVMIFSMSEPALKAELKIFGQGGKLLTEAEKSYSGEKPGMLLEIRWDKIEENITLMKLTAYDTNEFFSGMDISPWFVEIPHDEVVFPFDSSELQKTEEPKLDDSLKKIQKIIAEHGSELKIKLYIAGYTDTVGTKSYNYDLSDKRAKAIAAYFKAKGLNVLIFYQGFGEDCLAVKTEDETPEQKNRRAIYILGHQQPPVSPAIPRSNWKSLK